MKQHERVRLVQDAERVLRCALAEVGRMKLTSAEYTSVVVRVMADDVAGMMKFLIREERHGNSEKPGDLA